MGAVEHFKTICCLGLEPEATMVAVVPLLHEIIPHGWPRIWLFEPDATIGSCYGENPEAGAIFRERFWRFSNDPSGLASLVVPTFHGVGIGWSLHRQGRGWLDTAYYHEVEAPLDSCWVLDAMIGDNGRTIAGLHLTRPRSARPFQVGDVQILDRLRPWLAHGLRKSRPRHVEVEKQMGWSSTGLPVRSGQMILDHDENVVFQSPGLELLLRTLAGERADYLRRLPSRENLPPAIRTLVRQLVRAASAGPGFPPHRRIPCTYGVIDLDASWLLPAAVPPEDVAKDPRSCFVAVTIELRENAIAHAARVLRESGATPGQVKVGVHLALGKTKALIARDLGMRPATVADQTKKLYQRLGVHNAAELGLELWLHRKDRLAQI
jgi:DNA-binding CsgD family transcriptional regulator